MYIYIYIYTHITHQALCCSTPTVLFERSDGSTYTSYTIDVNILSPT